MSEKKLKRIARIARIAYQSMSRFARKVFLIPKPLFIWAFHNPQSMSDLHTAKRYAARCQTRHKQNCGPMISIHMNLNIIKWNWKLSY